MQQSGGGDLASRSLQLGRTDLSEYLGRVSKSFFCDSWVVGWDSTQLDYCYSLMVRTTAVV